MQRGALGRGPELALGPRGGPELVIVRRQLVRGSVRRLGDGQQAHAARAVRPPAAPAPPETPGTPNPRARFWSPAAPTALSTGSGRAHCYAGVVRLVCGAGERCKGRRAGGRRARESAGAAGALSGPRAGRRAGGGGPGAVAGGVGAWGLGPGAAAARTILSSAPKGEREGLRCLCCQPPRHPSSVPSVDARRNTSPRPRQPQASPSFAV